MDILPEHPKKDQLTILQEKYESLKTALERCLGITLDEGSPESLTIPLKEKSFPVHLSSEIGDITDFDVVLETLNQLGNERGVGFKKGVQKQHKGQPPYEKSIICRFKDRNKDKHHSYDGEKTEKTKKPLIKDIDCPVVYKFGVKDGKVIFQNAKEEHNHSLNLLLQKKLTPQMIQEISYFGKKTKICEVHHYLESKFDCKIDYMSVYHQYRKYYPRFGDQDCQNFINYLQINEARYQYVTENPDKTMCKLLFCTKLMLQNYHLYGDILIIDTTYNTNFYSTPLVVLSGVNNYYRNVIFGIALINNELESTYGWILSEFKRIMRTFPRLVVSDMDKSLTSAIRNEFPEVPHRLCAWHVGRNLRKQFRFLSSEEEELKKKIFALPWVYSRKKLDQYVLESKNYLQAQGYEKSIEYIEGLLSKKVQWARAYYPEGFDGDISTTSRVESWNALIKVYLHSQSQVSDIVDFIKHVEKQCNFASTLEASKGVYDLLEYASLLRDLKQILPQKVYEKHVIQYALGRRDYVKKIVAEDKESTTYLVAYEDKSKTEDLFENEIDAAEGDPIYRVISGERFYCDCGFFERTGMVCRHIFFICTCENMKDIRRLNISQRWLSLEFPYETHFAIPIEPLSEQGQAAIEATNLVQDENIQVIADKLEELRTQAQDSSHLESYNQNQSQNEKISLHDFLTNLLSQKGNDNQTVR